MKGKQSEEIIVSAEKKIGYHFPPTYRNFLIKYGAGNIGSSEIYGVISRDFENSSIPDAVWYALKMRKEFDFHITFYQSMI